MPTIPKRTVRRPWEPAPVERPAYQQHAARSPEYSSARWQKARAAHLKREPCCRYCTSKGRTTVATVVDHITPVRLGGDFWDTGNYQSLCRSCHQSKSASERTTNPIHP